MPPLQIRRGQNFDDIDVPLEGMILWDDLLARLGLYWGSEGGKITWTPSNIDSKFTIDKNGILTGFIDGEGQIRNRIALDFSTPDTIRFIDHVTNQEIASIGHNGLIASFVNVDASNIAQTKNLAINGDLAVRRNIGAVSSFTTAPATPSQREFMFAPNWHVWCKNDSVGTLTATFEDTDRRTKTDLMPRVLKITATGNPTKSGIRLYFPDYYAVAGRTCNLSFDVKAPADAKSQIRFVSSASASLDIQDIPEGTGQWERVNFPIFFPATGATWWAVDLLYEPSRESGASEVWLIGGVQFTTGAQMALYEPRHPNLQCQYVSTLYQEGRVHLVNASETKSVSLNGFAAPPTTIRFINPADGTPAYTDLDITGFDVNIPGLTNPSGSTLKFATFFAPAIA